MVPNATTTVSTLGGMIITAAIQYLTVTLPEQQRADANRDGVIKKADALHECRIKNDELYERLIDP